MNPQNPQQPQVPPMPPTPPQPPMPSAEPVNPVPEPTPAPASQPQPPVNPAFQPLPHDTPESTPATPQDGKPKVAKKGMGTFFTWLIFVVIFGALCFAPLTPGLVVANLPGNSDSLEVGGSTVVDCNGSSVQTKDQTDYQNKKGLPLSYSYAQVVTTSYECGGSEQFLGSSSVVVTNWLVAGVDAIVALVLASIATLIVSRLRNTAK